MTISVEMSRCLIIGCLVVLISQLQAQPSESIDHKIRLLKAPDDADSSYIMRYIRGNDIRLIYGGQGSNISYGSMNEGDALFDDALYHNVNDLAGFGLT